MDFIFESDLPYPEMDIQRPNANDVRLLLPLYAGKDSETTAILTYMYQTYVLPDTEVSRALERIAIVEMHHQEKLGHTINALGGTPIIGGNYNYWQGGYVNYSKDVKRILDNNINDEKKAIAEYSRSARLASTPYVSQLLERIKIDEEIHLAILQELRRLVDLN